MSRAYHMRGCTASRLYTIANIQNPVVSPAQFAPHCGANWVRLIELPHGPQASLGKATAKLGAQSATEPGQQLRTIGGPFGPSLLLTHDALANVPVGRDHLRVDRRGCPSLACPDDRAQVIEQRAERRLVRHRACPLSLAHAN